VDGGSRCTARVVQQALPVRTDIQHDGERPARVDASGCGVHRKLAHRDAHPADAPVADPEYGASVGGHNQVNIAAVQAERAQRRLDELGLIDRQVHPTRAPVLVAVMLDRLANRGRVDHRQHLGEMVGQHAVVQHLVTVVQLVQQDIACQVGRLTEELGIDASGLLVQRHVTGGYEADDPQVSPLGVAKGRALVDPRIGKHLTSAERRAPGAVLI
jgi:hypothetical protein